MASDVRITDNSAEVLKALGEQLGAALEAVGLKAEGYAKRLAPVDTGRLRNSISHAVSEDENATYIGTNVEYAPYVELGTSRTKEHPFLKPAVTDYQDEYIQIVKQYLKND